MELLIDKSNIDEFRNEIWTNKLKEVNFKLFCTPSNYTKILNKDDAKIEKIREEGLPITYNLTLNGFDKKVDMLNYFMINTDEVVCDRCCSSSFMLIKGNFNTSLKETVWMPKLETYISRDLLGMYYFCNPQVPVNYLTDYWVCPTCKEIHKFDYDCELGLIFNQNSL